MKHLLYRVPRASLSGAYSVMVRAAVTLFCD